MQDRGDCVAVDATILTIESVTLLSDFSDSKLLTHDVVCLTVAVVVNEYSIFSK